MPEEKKPKLKTYILVKEDVDIGHAMVAVAHAGAILILEGHTADATPTFMAWLKDSFKKVVCKVNSEQFHKAAQAAENRYIVTESSLGGKEVAIVFQPREEWPEMFKTFPLYR